MFVMISNPL